MGSVTLECLNPQNELVTPAAAGLKNKRVSKLDGKKIAIVWCGKSGGENYLEVVAGLLKEKYPDSSIIRYTWGVENAEDRIIAKSDTFIYGVGDSGIGAWESTARAILLEKRGKPGVVVFCDHLMPNAIASARAQGLPSVRIVTLPSIDYYPSRGSVDLVRAVALKTINSIIGALTGPITPEEANPRPPYGGIFNKVSKLTASNYEQAYEKFNSLFLKNHWGDGLPLVPPTIQAVKAMLSGTALSPNEIIGSIPTPDGLATMGKVTVENISINAVMAGAKPEYLPVIIAAMACLTDKNYSPHVFTSEGSFTIVIAVSGPVVKKIGMNSGFGLFGHGWRANNTIGRAVRLCLINLGRLWPGEYDLALIGRPSSHTFYVFAENADYCPWEPYHVNMGYDPEDSCVTASTVGGHGSNGIKMYGGGTVAPWTAESVLDQIIKDISVSRNMFGGYKAGVGVGLGGQPQKYIFILHPEMANELKKMGFSGKSLHNYIIDKTSVPFEELEKQEVEGIKNRMNDTGEAFFGSSSIPSDRVPVFRRALRPGGKVPVIISPDDLNIFVAGGISGYTFGMSYLRGAHLTKLIR